MAAGPRRNDHLEGALARPKPARMTAQGGGRSQEQVTAAIGGQVVTTRRGFTVVIGVVMMLVVEKVVMVVVVVVVVIAFAVTAATIVMVLKVGLHELVAGADIVLDGGVGVAHRGAQLGDRVTVA